ncbi:Isochorismatase hydrolase [Mollisia scopiformis]|uniref:Isochorismatase hydrolase n=1 Tax=Mollisia scopiformis TaxID=149040 RepID=A0A194XD91_MOLSC|nr:Isochorismatase hydrolase [Mollisia scopiformis]KUJ18145.1 Isochorismatase hydrolase [Mollisia scopiformis]
MFEIDENNLPFVRTRQALLLLDLQNDFVSTGGILPVEQPPDFLDRTLKLLPEFRTSGNIIWIRTVFEASRPINEPVGDSESVITDNELDPKHRGGDAHLRARLRPSQRLIERHRRIAEANGIPLEGDAAIEVEEEEQEEMEVEETYLTLRPKQLPQAVLPTSPGTNFSQAASMRIDGKKDLIFQKTWYSAFKDGSLVQTLRAKFVTEIYLCGALTNISVFATAMDAARHGYAITIVEDCLGYRSKARHDEALRRLVEFAGCEIISSEELIEDLQQKARRHQTPPRKNQNQNQNQWPQAKAKAASSSTGIENLMASLNLRPDGTSTPGHKAVPTGSQDDVAATETGDSESHPSEEWSLPAKPTSITTAADVDGKKRERVKTKIKTRRRHSKSAPKEATEGSSIISIGQTSPISATLLAATQALEKLPNSFLSEHKQSVDAATSHSLKHTGLEPDIPRQDNIDAAPIAYCEGDTTVVHNLLDEDAADGIFEKLRDEVRWQRMSHQGGEVPRLVAVQGDIDHDGSIPIYRHPADESPALLPFSPTVSLIKAQAEKKLGHALNHVLIQYYRDSTDHITEHSDKTLDIVRNTFICNVSLGAQRTMTFRTKRPLKGTAEAEAAAGKPREVQRVQLPHNSMAKVGLVTNMRWLHAIRPDKRMAWEKSPEELAYDCGRISLTFRLIGTFLSKDQTKIWGQGAVAKSKDKAKPVINGDAAESEKMIRAFSKENFSSEFDWESIYGAGLDVLHISNWSKLILSGDFVADLRVKLMLAEYGITWVESRSSAAFNWKDGPPCKDPEPSSASPIKFVDNDSSQSTVVGDMAIMLYLDSVYGPKPVVNGPDLAKQFTRLQQAGELLKKWRTAPFDLEPFRQEMAIWDAFATEASYIAGSGLSIADFALWPVLEEIRREWKDIEGFDNIVAYYDRVRNRDSVVKVLGAREQTNDAGKA